MQAPPVFAVGIDGSMIAYKALDIVLSLARSERGDKVVCIHVPDPAGKSSLLGLKDQAVNNQDPQIMRLETCKRLNEDDLVMWAEAPKTASETTTEVLLRAAKTAGVQYLGLGAFGRKGEANLLTGENEVQRRKKKVDADTRGNSTYAQCACSAHACSAHACSVHACHAAYMHTCMQHTCMPTAYMHACSNMQACSIHAAWHGMLHVVITNMLRSPNARRTKRITEIDAQR